MGQNGTRPDLHHSTGGPAYKFHTIQDIHALAASANSNFLQHRSKAEPTVSYLILWFEELLEEL